MHPSSILSYYPTYSVLDEVISQGNYDTLNLYFDLKNNLQSLYMEHTIRNIIDSTTKSGITDSSIFSSIISFIAFHKMYARKRQIKINIYIFFESGTSFFHTNIRKKYKISRRIDDLYGLEREKRELFFTVMHKNLILAERACNSLPGVKLFRMNHLEADFIPYYLISRNLVNTNENTGHIVYSNDHDLLQCLTAGEHVYVFQKAFKTKRLVKSGEALYRSFKVKTTKSDELLPLAMSVIGDTGDDVDGIKGVGPKRALDMMDSLIQLTGGMDLLYDNIMTKQPIFDISRVKTPNKYLNKVITEEENNKLISDNLKLVSFELLSRYLDDPGSIEMVKLREYVNKINDDKTFSLIEPLREAINKLNVVIQEEDLTTIYFGYL